MLDINEVLAKYGTGDDGDFHLRVNFVASLDGAVTRDGLSDGLNNEDDLIVFSALRRLSDVVLVGAGTVRAEDYRALRLSAESVRWRQEHGLQPHPVMAVVSGNLDLDPGLRIFANPPHRPLVFTTAEAPAERAAALADVAEVIRCGGEYGGVDVTAMLAELERRGLRRVLSEGGPHLFSALLAADRVDELCLTLSPFLEAGTAGRITAPGPHAGWPMRLGHTFAAGDMIFLRYFRDRSEGAPFDDEASADAGSSSGSGGGAAEDK
ncbi:pyrimidine reductase family protein [Arthrobacter ginkgonis]